MPANIGAELQALPLGFLLAAPMTAAIEAQALAAQTTADFLQNVTLEVDPASGATSAVMVNFSFQQSVTDPADPTNMTPQTLVLSVPLLAITQVPYLRINDLTVNFEFKIRNIQSVASALKLSTSSSATTSSSFQSTTSTGGGISKFLGLPASSTNFQNNLKLTFNASATYQRTDRDTTDRSATFKMNLNAVQDPIPEGMRRVLEIMADAIKAQLAEPAGGGGGGADEDEDAGGGGNGGGNGGGGGDGGGGT